MAERSPAELQREIEVLNQRVANLEQLLMPQVPATTELRILETAQNFARIGPEAIHEWNKGRKPPRRRKTQ